MRPKSQTPGDSGLGLANDARMIRTTYVFGQVPSSNLVFFSIASSLLQVYGPGTHQTQRIIMHATRHRPFSPPLSESITFSNTPMWSRWSPGTFVVVQCPCRTSPSPSLGRPVRSTLVRSPHDAVIPNFFGDDSLPGTRACAVW